MTNEEAINILNDYDINFERNAPEEVAEAHEMAIEALKTQPSEDCISRKAAIDALWKALHEYEDKTEKQFLESKELDVADWFQHRIFVQNMSDIDRQTILDLPSVAPQSKAEGVRSDIPLQQSVPKIPQPSECKYCHEDSDGYVKPLEKNCHAYIGFGMRGWVIELKAKGWRGKAPIKFCPMCGRRLING